MRILPAELSWSCAERDGAGVHQPRRSIPRSPAPPVRSSSMPKMWWRTARQRCSYRVPLATELSTSVAGATLVGFGREEERVRVRVRVLVRADIDVNEALRCCAEACMDREMARGSKWKVQGGELKHDCGALTAVSRALAVVRPHVHTMLCMTPPKTTTRQSLSR